MLSTWPLAPSEFLYSINLYNLSKPEGLQINVQWIRNNTMALRIWLLYDMLHDQKKPIDRIVYTDDYEINLDNHEISS
jgi:hypothetical protein